MNLSSVGRRVRRSASPIESLEGRLFLSATLASQVPAQSVFVGQVGSVNLGTYFNDPAVTGTAVEIQTPEGNIPLALTDSKTPMTVANFVHYINAGEYNDVLINRSVPGFVIQGGGFQPNGTANPTFAAVPSEAGTSNTTGTIAMALSSAGPNSGTNQWFINLGNNTGLDSSGPSSGNSGPFTVFGNVIYNGMSVVNDIASLSIVDDSAQIPQYGTAADGNPFGTLPVLPSYAGPNPATTVDPSDLVTTNTVVVPALSYSVSVADPTVFSATIANGTLSLTPQSGITSGATTVTVTATDLGGGTTSSTFAVALSDGTTDTVTIGTNAAKSVTYTDSNGTKGTVALKGPGTANVVFSGTGLLSHANKNNTVAVTSTAASISNITTAGTTGATTLTITTRGGTRSINLGGLTTDSLKSFSAKTVTLAGDLSATGSIGTLAVAGAAGGTITLPSIGTFTATGAVSDAVTLTSGGLSLGKFTAKSIAGGTWTVSGNIKSITAGAVAGWMPVVAGAIASMTISKGDLSGAISAASIATLHIKGSLNNATLTLTGGGNDLANLSVVGSIINSTINATGNLGNISAMSLNTSQIYAGIAPLSSGQPLPNFPSDFATNQSIASVRLRTVRSGDSFFNANIAAQTLGTLSLGTILTNNGGFTTGVASEDIKSFIATFAPNHVNLKNLTSASNITMALADKNVELGDFVLKLF